MGDQALFESLEQLFPGEPLRAAEIFKDVRSDQKLADEIRETARYGAKAVESIHELWKLEIQACLRALAKAKDGGTLSSWEAATAGDLVYSDDRLRRRVLNAEVLGSFDTIKEMLGTMRPLLCLLKLLVTFGSSARGFLITSVVFLHR